MDKTRLQDEMSYRIGKYLLQKMLQDDLITQEEFAEIVQTLLQEWNPPIAMLFESTETIPDFVLTEPFPYPEKDKEEYHA